MDSSPILQVVLQSVSPHDWPAVFAALRQDKLLWECSHDPECSALLLAAPHDLASDWSPASLAVASLERGISLKLLNTQPLQPLEPGLRLLALRAYEALPQPAADGECGCQAEELKSKPEDIEEPGTTRLQTLRQACLLALALRERFRLTGQWHDLGAELSLRTPLTLDTWRTPFAILYGLSPQPTELLRALIHPKRTRTEWELGLHALLCSPITPEEHLEALQTVVLQASFTPEQSLDLVRLVSQADPALGQETSAWFLEQGFLDNNTEQTTSLEACEHALRLAETQAAAGDETGALHSIEQARNFNQRLQAELEAAWAYLANLLDKKEPNQTASTHKVTEALRKSAATLTHQPESAALLSETESFLREVLLQTGDTDETRKWLEQLSLPADEAEGDALHSTQPPALYLQAARFAQQADEAELCANLLSKALHTLERSQPDSQPHSIRQRLQPASYQMKRDLIDLTEIAMETGQKKIAKQAARLVLQRSMPDPMDLVALGEALYEPNDPQEASSVFEMAVGLLPTHLEARRWLATALEAQNAWEPALPHRSFTVSHLQSTQQLNSEDLHALGHCASLAGHYPVAVKAGLQALEVDPQDLTAHLLLADTYQKTGDYAAASEHYRQVTQSAPGNSDAWNGLAQIQQHLGQTKHATETLRAAAQALPEDVDIHLSLGKILFAEQSLTPALASLQKAYSLSRMSGCGDVHPSGDQAALLYGKALLQLGQVSKARQVLGEVYANPGCGDSFLPEVAENYARALLADGDTAAAVKPLETALQLNADEPELHLVFARTLLKLHQKPAQAVLSLQKVLQANPDSLEAQGWLAVGLDETEQTQPAFQAYQKVLETSLVKDIEWRARLSFGLGRTALKLGQNELALAALQEAVQHAPDQSEYQQRLAEAYWAVNLPSNALQIARGVLQIERDNPDALAWYADQVLYSLQSKNTPAPKQAAKKAEKKDADQPGPAEAINVLRHAIELQPDRPDLHTRLAQLQLFSGEAQQAADSLQAIITIESLPLPLLHQAARLAEEAGNPRLAADFYRRAAQLIKESDALAYRAVLLKLANSQAGAENYHAALQTLRQLIANDPSDAQPYLLQARIFQSLEQPENIVSSLETALQAVQKPADLIQVHSHLAQAHHLQGKYPAAYYHASLAAQLAAKMGSNDVEIFLLAGELARTLLLNEPAQVALSQAINAAAVNSAANNPTPGDLLIRLHSLGVELACENSETSGMAAELEISLRSNPRQPRLMAAQARLLLRQADAPHALAAYQALNTVVPNPLSRLPEGTAFKAADWQSQALAAADFADLEKALAFAHLAQGAEPLNPSLALLLARLLVQAAEHQQLCNEVEVVTHLPGFNALSVKSREACQQYLHNADNLLRSARTSLQEKGLEIGPCTELQCWKARLPLAFSTLAEDEQPIITPDTIPVPDEPAPWISSVSDAAAWLAHMRRTMPAAAAPALDHMLSQYPDQLSIALQAALHQAPSSPLTALALLQRGTAATAPYPLPVIALAYQANLHMLAAQPEEAESCIIQALAIWPDEPRWHGLAASIQQALPVENTSAELQEIFRHLEEAIRLEPKHLPYYLSLGEITLSHKASETTLAAKATRLLERAARIHTANGEIWLQLAQLHARSSQASSLDQAARCAEQAIQHSIALPKGGKDIRAFLLRAEIALRQGQPEQALPYIEKAQAGDPGSLDALLAQVRALKAMDQPTQALKVLERVIPLVEDSLPLALQRAELLVQSGEFESALGLLNQLATAYPTHPEVFVRMAHTLSEAGDTPHAIQAAQAALQVGNSANTAAPLSAQAQAELHRLLGVLSARTGQLDSAIHHLDQAIRLAPAGVESYLELGQVYQKQRQYMKAQQVYHQAMAAAPSDYRSFYQSGLALKDNKDYLGSESMLRRAVDLAPENVTIRRQLAAVVALNLVHNPRSVAN